MGSSSFDDVDGALGLLELDPCPKRMSSGTSSHEESGIFMFAVSSSISFFSAGPGISQRMTARQLKK